MRSIKPGAVALAVALVGVLAACDGQSPPAAATDAEPLPEPRFCHLTSPVFRSAQYGMPASSESPYR